LSRSQQRRPADRSWATYGPAWSDDGRTLAFSLYVGREGFVIATVPWPRPVAAPWTYGDAEWMTFPVPVTPGNESVAWDFDPSWAPSGRQIVYWAAGSLIVLDADGTKHVIATGANTDGPAWSPDGRLIAFSRCTSEASGCSLWVVQPDGTRLRRLTDSTLNATAPSWSPDGRRLVFEANGGVWTIRRYEPRLRSHPQRLVESGAGPSWSPDGTQIAFARGDGVYVVDRDGSHPTRLVAMPPWAGLGRLQTDWQPKV